MRPASNVPPACPSRVTARTSPCVADRCVADADNHVLRLVSLVSGSTTLDGFGPDGPGTADGQSPSFNGPLGVDFAPDNGRLAVADEQNASVRLLASPLSSPRGKARTLAGGTVGFVDGTGTTVRFNQPADVAFSPDGERLVVADTG